MEETFLQEAQGLPEPHFHQFADPNLSLILISSALPYVSIRSPLPFFNSIN